MARKRGPKKKCLRLLEEMGLTISVEPGAGESGWVLEIHRPDDRGILHEDDQSCYVCTDWHDVYDTLQDLKEVWHVPGREERPITQQ